MKKSHMNILFEKLIKNYNSIICLHGNLPYEFLKKSKLPIIAADGAANELFAHKIEPKIIIGDLDSVDESVLKNYRYEKIEDQNFCDFEKTLGFINSHAEFSPAIITGINGGFLDHILNNLCIFSNTKFLYFSQEMLGIVLENSIELELPIDTKISIFGAPSAIVCSDGLRWELDYRLDFFGHNSFGNRTTIPKISLKVKDGKALVFIYLKEIKDGGCFLKKRNDSHKCLICKKIFFIKTFYPFCSRHCKNVDLNNWLSEIYYVRDNKSKKIK